MTDTFQQKNIDDSGKTRRKCYRTGTGPAAKYRIAKFVKDHETWILAQQEKLEKYRENMHVITDEERQEGILQAKKIFPERTAYFAEGWELPITESRSGNRKPVGEAAVLREISTSTGSWY